ncbi:MAG: hypothetical protein HQL52_05265 [Magnetococcales bacterium]|nr:hypothetical protein [Magnetococcales bacterium]
MNVTTSWRRGPLLWTILILLIGFSVVASGFLVSGQRRQLSRQDDFHHQLEMALISSFLAESLALGDFSQVVDHLRGLFEKHPNIIVLKAISKNGFVLSDLSRSPSEHGVVQLQRELPFGRDNHLTVTLDMDQSAMESALTDLYHGLLGIFGLFILLLWGALWVTIKKLALDPMALERERENARQAHELNRTLEEQVAKRTADLKWANHKLGQANQELESFSYTVSHDLRAPLRSLSGFSEALLEDYGERLDHQGRSFLGFIQEGSREMNSMIEGLLHLSRMTRGTLTMGRINLSEIMAETARSQAILEPNRRVEVEVAQGHWVWGDLRLLKVLSVNLLGNAWKFTAEGDSALIQFGSTTREGSPCYFVRDNGVGFDMKDADRLFAPFQRLHTSGRFEGTGIGLATVKRIIKRHGGKLWAESQPGEGAVFFFTLPLGSGMDGEGEEVLAEGDDVSKEDDLLIKGDGVAEATVGRGDGGDVVKGLMFPGARVIKNGDELPLGRRLPGERPLGERLPGLKGLWERLPVEEESS